MGNDVDDALALGVIHALASRGECELLAVTLSKDNPFAVQFCELVNAFYGRPYIPLGRVRGGKTPEDGKFVRQVVESAGRATSAQRANGEADAPEATAVLRRTLAAQPDGSVVFVVVGFSTNVARLLESKPDKHSPLDGRALVAQKAKLLSMMAGRFGADRPQDFREYNVHVDVPSAARVFQDWPTPIVISGFEIGLAIEYPAASIENDYNYVPQHPLKEAYVRYEKMPYDRPTWDLTSVLYAVRPNRGYFGLTEPGRLSIGDIGCAVFTPAADGTHRCLTVTPEQIARVREALVLLASQPPH
jgi:inosine-uridine nucleoside N-ribohydrolase